MRRQLFTCCLAVITMALVAASCIAGDCFRDDDARGPRSCDQDDGCSRKKLRLRLCIPGIRWETSIGCACCDDDRCDGDGCDRRRRCCWWWDEMAPPRAPVVFSVPAITVPQAAVAVTPVPQALIAQPQQCAPRQDDPASRLLMEVLARQMDSQQAATQTEAAAPAAQTTDDTEARLAELEKRLDRILNALEQRGEQ